MTNRKRAKAQGRFDEVLVCRAADQLKVNQSTFRNIYHLYNLLPNPAWLSGRLGWTHQELLRYRAQHFDNWRTALRRINDIRLKNGNDALTEDDFAAAFGLKPEKDSIDPVLSALENVEAAMAQLRREISAAEGTT